LGQNGDGKVQVYRCILISSFYWL